MMIDRTTSGTRNIKIPANIARSSFGTYTRAAMTYKIARMVMKCGMSTENDEKNIIFGKKGVYM